VLAVEPIRQNSCRVGRQYKEKSEHSARQKRDPMVGFVAAFNYLEKISKLPFMVERYMQVKTIVTQSMSTVSETTD
jgi:hypothetical protein